MIIRKAQMDALSDYVFQSFVQRMVVRLRAKCPEQTSGMSDDEIGKFVSAAVDRANSFNVHTEKNLVTFLEFATRYGMDFYTAAPFNGAQDVLENERLNETVKMNRVNEYLIFR